MTSEIVSHRSFMRIGFLSLMLHTNESCCAVDISNIDLATGSSSHYIGSLTNTNEVFLFLLFSWTRKVEKMNIFKNIKEIKVSWGSLNKKRWHDRDKKR